jgi:hypothetical protein
MIKPASGGERILRSPKKTSGAPDPWNGYVALVRNASSNWAAGRD